MTVKNAQHRSLDKISIFDLRRQVNSLQGADFRQLSNEAVAYRICMLAESADALLVPLEAWMIQVNESTVHPESGVPLWRVDFLRRSHPIGGNGAINWRAPAEGIEPAEIMRFVQRRMQNLTQWPRSTTS